MKEKAKTDPEAQAKIDKAEKAAVGASWAAFVGIMLSMASAIGGAMVGRGVAFRFIPTATRVTAVSTEPRREILIP